MPHPYRYVTKQDGDGEARFEIVLEEARVVRQVFEWVGRDRCSIGEVSRRLQAAGERTRTGKTVWDRATVWGMLKNPAYKGEAAFGKTVVEPSRPRLRAQRGRPLQPKRPYSHHDVPAEQWMSIPVPALVDADLFDSVAEQLQENRAHARGNAVHGIYCRACLLVAVAGMRTQVNRLVQAHANIMSARMHTIAVLARMRIGLVEYESARTNNYARIW